MLQAVAQHTSMLSLPAGEGVEGCLPGAWQCNGTCRPGLAGLAKQVIRGGRARTQDIEGMKVLVA